MPSLTWNLTVWTASGHQPSGVNCQVSIDPALIYGSQSVFGSCLRVPYEVAWYPEELPAKEVVLLSLEGWIAGATDLSDARGIRIPAQTTVPYSVLSVPLTAEQIEIIEDQRHGDAALFKVMFAGLAVIPSLDVESAYTVRDRYSNAVSEEMRARLDTVRIATQGDGPLRIEREQWLKILDGLGVGTRRLVELPAPALPKNVALWATCLRYLEQATQHHRQGEYEQAIRFCRDVVQGIAIVIGESWNIRQKQGQSFEGWTKEIEGRLKNALPTEKESPAMLSSLLFAAWSWTSPNAHYQTDIPKREEAAFALSLATDLLMFASQLLIAHPHIGPLGGSDSGKVAE